MSLDTLVGTPNELKALEDIQKAVEAGQDPFGDDDEDAPIETTETDDASQTGKDTDEPNGEGAEAEKPVDQVEEEEKQEVVSAADGFKVDQIAPQKYEASLPESYAEKRAELMKMRAENMNKLMDSEIDAETYSEAEAKVFLALEDLSSARIRAETLAEASNQQQVNYQRYALSTFANQVKGEVDYMTDAKAQKQFDIALQMIATDADNAGRDYAVNLAEAHKAVMAMRGITPKKAEAKPVDLQKKMEERLPKEGAPVTLRQIPAAATPNAGGDVFEKLGRLKGQAYEAAFNALSPAQKAKLLEE